MSTIKYYMNGENVGESRIWVEFDDPVMLAGDVALAAVTMLYEALRSKGFPPAPETDVLLTMFRASVANQIQNEDEFGSYAEYCRSVEESDHEPSDL